MHCCRNPKTPIFFVAILKRADACKNKFRFETMIASRGRDCCVYHTSDVTFTNLQAQDVSYAIIIMK